MVRHLKSDLEFDLTNGVRYARNFMNGHLVRVMRNNRPPGVLFGRSRMSSDNKTRVLQNYRVSRMSEVTCCGTFNAQSVPYG